MKSKKRNFQLKDDLKKYSAIAGAFTGMTALAHGQIVYVDINPDVVLENDSTWTVDFDQGGTNDLDITQYNYNGSGVVYSVVGAEPYNGGVVGYKKMVGGYDYSFASALNQNDAINQGNNWYSGGGLMGIVGTIYGNPINEGEWRGQNDKYLGVKFQISGQDHYGWVRLDVTANSNRATIKDYAYNTVPNTQILAGEIGAVGIGNQELEGIQAYSFDKSLHISFNNPKSDFTVEVYNMLGERVYSAGLSGSRHEIRLNDFASGIYLAEMSSQGKIFRKKFHLN